MTVGTGHPTIRVRHQMIECIIKSVIASSIDATREALYAKAMELQLKGQCVDAVKNLERAIVLGHLLSRAALAEILTKGREGISQDRKRAYVLVRDGLCMAVGTVKECYQCSICTNLDANKMKHVHLS